MANGSKTYKPHIISIAPEIKDGSSLPNSLLKSLSNEESKPSEITAKAT